MQVTVELTTPEGHTYRVGRLSTEERAQKILRCAPAGTLSQLPVTASQASKSAAVEIGKCKSLPVATPTATAA